MATPFVFTEKKIKIEGQFTSGDCPDLEGWISEGRIETVGGQCYCVYSREDGSILITACP